MSIPTVTKGLATWLGIIGAVAAILPPFIAELADASEPLGVPAGVWPVVSAAILIATIAGRMAQAMVLAAHAPTFDQLPEDPPDTPTDVPADQAQTATP